jgi:NMD protein affecting ribosome stability and mRNA decay
MDKSSYGRNDRLIKEKRHDTYRERGKLTENSSCTQCGALYVNGRWSWKKAAKKVTETVCPACQRIADKYPAGLIEIKGNFIKEHSEELVNLIRNVEKVEKSEHPLERIMTMTELKDHTLVTTTGVHIARRIGEALSRSYAGDYSFQYADAEKSIRISWER